jgi:hypothetical protein
MSDDPTRTQPPPPTTPPPPPPSTPPTSLYIPQFAFEGSSAAKRRAVARAELQFAAKVCHAAKDSYEEIVRILDDYEMGAAAA